jgi:hypothetical protein
LAVAVLINFAIPSTIHSDYDEALHNPLSSLSDTPSIDEVKRATSYIAVKYGLSEADLMRTLDCESGFRYDAKNKNSTASGVAQYIDSTWNDYCVKVYGFTDKKSAKQQLQCMTIFWQNGEQHQWECY